MSIIIFKNQPTVGVIIIKQQEEHVNDLKVVGTVETKNTI